MAGRWKKPAKAVKSFDVLGSVATMGNIRANATKTKFQPGLALESDKQGYDVGVRFDTDVLE
jgi:hypothetical protein